MLNRCPPTHTHTLMHVVLLQLASASGYQGYSHVVADTKELQPSTWSTYLHALASGSADAAGPESAFEHDTHAQLSQGKHSRTSASEYQSGSPKWLRQL